MPNTSNIIDLFYKDAVDFARLKEEGIVAVIHKSTEGRTFNDPKYRERKQAAKAEGLLWGAYHFTSSSDWEDQVNFFLDTVAPEGDDLIAWDWETPKHDTPMTLAHVRDSVELIHNLLGRYPVLYGGNLIRENIGDKEDLLLKNCPLWYARYNSAPVGIPRRTWPSYTLWQYTASDSPNPSQNPPGPLRVGGQLSDRNLYSGDEADLKAKWPFT